MSTEHEPPMPDYLFDTGLTFQKMRLIIEGAIMLYTDETSDLFLLARERNQYMLAETYSAIGCALYDLRDIIRDLQKSYIKETIRQIATESP